MLTAVAPPSYASFDREWGERDGWADYPELAEHPVWAIDDHAGYTNAALRRIHSCDPTTGKDFVFITTCQHLRPGLIALLYFLRW